MYLHKERDKLNELFKFLPARYRKEVCKRMKLDFNDANKQKIWRVKTGETSDNEILACLIKLARSEKKLIEINKQLLEAE